MVSIVVEMKERERPIFNLMLIYNLLFCLLQSSHLPQTSVQGAVEAAIAAGYRHIDTAYSYGNEVDIGKAVRSKMQQGIIRRQDMFIVSKVSAKENRCYSRTRVQHEEGELHLICSHNLYKLSFLNFKE